MATLDADFTLLDVLASDELLRRPPRLRDPWPEIVALQALTQRALSAPDEVLKLLVEQAMALCQAQSAGISLLEGDGACFRWIHTHGVYGAFEGGSVPTTQSPCAVALARAEVVLMRQPERYFTFMQPVAVANEEVLLTPLYCGSETPTGTLWVVQHDRDRHFDSGDVRTLTALSGVANVALQARADHERQAQLLEQEQRLTREVGHRIKNNLQLLASLLSLQARSADSDETKQALAAAMQRVSLIADISNRLHQDRGLLQIDLDAALRELSLQFEVADPRFAVSYAGMPVPASAEVATNVAVLACEFVANAMKHGATQIEIALTHDANGLQLRVADDGPGFPAGFDPARSRGLGMRLAAGVCRQFGGTLSFENHAGAVVRLALPDAQYRG